MSLDKAITHGKEHRKPYRRSKAWDTSCRNHGSCSWCQGNRLHKYRKEQARLDFEYQDFLQNDFYYCRHRLARDLDECFYYCSRTWLCGACWIGNERERT